MTTTEQRRETAARAIAKARDNGRQGYTHLDTTPAYDYHLAYGNLQAEICLQNALYEIANEGHPGCASEREARWKQLAADLAEEIEAYRRKCRERKYTGWSNASRGPIRYAD